MNAPEREKDQRLVELDQLSGSTHIRCDLKAERLAEISYSFYPGETGMILLEGVKGAFPHLPLWLSLRDRGNFATSPCREIKKDLEERRR